MALGECVSSWKFSWLRNCKELRGTESNLSSAVLAGSVISLSLQLESGCEGSEGSKLKNLARNLV